MAQETQTGALHQPRWVGWGGRWEGGSKKGGDICIPMADSWGRKESDTTERLIWSDLMADSCWGLTENSKILQSNYPSIKNKYIKKLYCGLFQTFAERACIQIFNLQVHDSRAVVLQWELEAESHRELVTAQIPELHIYSLRLKVLEWDPEFPLLTSSLVMQMLLGGNHTLRTIVRERTVKEPPIIPSPNCNQQQLIAKLDSHISSPLPLSQTIFKKASEIFLFLLGSISMQSSKIRAIHFPQLFILKMHKE